MNKPSPINFINILLGLLLWVIIIFVGIRTANAAPYMGDCKLSTPRTYTISIDPDLKPAFDPILNQQDILNFISEQMTDWNLAFITEYGFPVFEVHYGNWQEADLLITAHGDQTRTWVETRCNGGFVQRGNNLAIMHLASNFQGGNLAWMRHELGHFLGFSDYVPDGQDVRGYLSPGYCSQQTQPSIMSYCTNSFFLREGDHTLIRNYWK